MPPKKAKRKTTKRRRQRGGEHVRPPGGPIDWRPDPTPAPYLGTLDEPEPERPPPKKKPAKKPAAPESQPWHRRIISRSLRAVGLNSWADKAHQMGLGVWGDDTPPFMLRQRKFTTMPVYRQVGAGRKTHGTVTVSTRGAGIMK